MSKQYIVISFGPDGIYIHHLEKLELEKRLNEEYWGSNPNFFSSVPENLDRGEGLIIVEGKIVSPKIVTTVTEWEM